MNHEFHNAYRGRPLIGPAAALLLAAALVLCACEGCRTAASNPRLAHAAASREALAKEILRALREGDLQKMKGMSLSKEEFRRFVWPELPVSNRKTNVSLEYVWNDLFFRSMSRMQYNFNKLKGNNLKLVRIVHRGRVEEFRSHRAYPDMEVILHEAGGKEFSYPLFGTLIEMDGLWKIYSYAPYD